MTRFEAHQIEDLAGEYASGALDPALAFMFETQATLRPDVAETLHEAEDVATAFFEEEPCAALSPDALNAALERVEQLETCAVQGKTAAMAAGKSLDELMRLPEPLRGKALEAAAETGWRAASPGIRRMKLTIDNSPALVELYRLEPGARTPKHTHGGPEATLVVTGGFTDVSGAYGPGDISIKGEQDTHQPVADPGEICFALSVSDGGIRLTGALGIVQRLFNL